GGFSAILAMSPHNAYRFAATACAHERRSDSQTDASAADLKSLHRLRHTRLGTSNRKSGTNIIYSLVPLLLPKFVSEIAEMYHELRKRGTRPPWRAGARRRAGRARPTARGSLPPPRRGCGRDAPRSPAWSASRR